MANRGWIRRWSAETGYSPAELAKLCQGWDPSVEHPPDLARYHDALEAILRAVRLGDLAVIGPVPDTREEFLEGRRVFLRRQSAWAWAAKRFPLFPFGENESRASRSPARGRSGSAQRSVASGTDWMRHWSEETGYSPSELAKLCHGWNPDDELGDPVAYNVTLGEIDRAVRLGDLTLFGKIPASSAERFYGEGCFVKRSAACAWAASRYRAFPFGDQSERASESEAKKRSGVTEAGPPGSLPKDTGTESGHTGRPQDRKTPPSGFVPEAVPVRLAAKILSLSEDKVCQMIKRGEIEAVRLGPRSTRIPRSEFARLRTLKIRR